MKKVALLIGILLCAFLAWRFVICNPLSSIPRLPIPFLSVSPNYQSGLPGENLLYTVTVINRSDVSDNFVLTARDNLGWGLALSDKLLQIPPDEIRYTTLIVAIPENAIPSTEDQLIVTAASQTYNIRWNIIFYARVILPKSQA